MTSLETVPFAQSNSQDDYRRNARAHLALSELGITLAHPVRGLPLLKSIQTETTIDPAFFDKLLADNNDIFQKQLDNEFCKKIAALPAGNKSMDANFKWYMLQDMLYLKNYVYWKLGVLSASDWDTVVAAEDPLPPKKPSITGDIGYVKDAITVLQGPLGISGSVINKAVASFEVENYFRYLLSSTRTENWFAIMITIIPCLVGYEKIANHYKADATIDKTSLFYTQWVAPNATGTTYYDKYKALLNSNVEKYRSPIAQDHWNKLFRTSAQMEISFWNAALVNKL